MLGILLWRIDTVPENETEWVKVNEVSAAGTTMTEYVDLTGRRCKQVWNDGYVEVFEIAN